MAFLPKPKIRQISLRIYELKRSSHKTAHWYPAIYKRFTIYETPSKNIILSLTQPLRRPGKKFRIIELRQNDMTQYYRLRRHIKNPPEHWCVWVGNDIPSSVKIASDAYSYSFSF